MARLRNRILKADFWTDAELLRWPREKRWTYQGLWELAEDSGCLEDDPFGWKLLLWPSPNDTDITVERMEEWRQELIAAKKVIVYEADGKSYLYLTKFHQHEHPRNPQKADLPLPAWVAWEENPKDPRKGQYKELTDLVQALYNDATTVPALPCPARSCPTPPTPSYGETVENLLALAATVQSGKGTWKPSERDAKTFATILERFPEVQVRQELLKFKAYAFHRQYTKFGRTFASWMGRVEPQSLPPAQVAWKAPADEPLSDEDRAASLDIIRQARQRVSMA